MKCMDCGVPEGNVHFPNCDMERCSKCGKQVLAWGKCEGAKPEPFFFSGYSCIRYGKSMPDLKMVSDDEWKFICGGTYEEDCVLCKPCMNFIKQKREEKRENDMGNQR